MDALQLSIQPEPAASCIDSMWVHARRAARGLADRRRDARRCAGAARRPRVRESEALGGGVPATSSLKHGICRLTTPMALVMRTVGHRKTRPLTFSGSADQLIEGARFKLSGQHRYRCWFPIPPKQAEKQLEWHIGACAGPSLPSMLPRHLTVVGAVIG